MLKKLLSYFVPVNIYRKNSGVSKSLEVTWNNGELVLDSANTNYSFGSLQRILRKGLISIGFDNVIRMKHVLVLGVAGGSVIRTLVNEIKYTGNITGVEIDPDVIQVAREYFELDKIERLNLVIDDAFEFVLKTREKYDLIIVDIFQDTKMPSFLFEDFFAFRLTDILQDAGYILFNTMILLDKENKRNQDYISIFAGKPFEVRALPRVEQHNELIIIHKPRTTSSSESK